MDYHVVEETSRAEFEEQVNVWIKLGYELYGPPQFHEEPAGFLQMEGDRTYRQAMVRR